MLFHKQPRAISSASACRVSSHSMKIDTNSLNTITAKTMRYTRKPAQAWRLHLRGCGELWHSRQLRKLLSSDLPHTHTHTFWCIQPQIFLTVGSLGSIQCYSPLLPTYSWSQAPWKQSYKCEALDSYSSDSLYWISSFTHPKSILGLKEVNILWSWVTKAVWGRKAWCRSFQFPLLLCCVEGTRL